MRASAAKVHKGKGRPRLGKQALRDEDLTVYQDWLTSLKARVRLVQIRTVVSANTELVLLYWQIGQDILERQAQQGWGAMVVSRLATDLQHEFPEMKGFSPRNLKYMRAFAEAWPDSQFVQQLVAQLPWGHNTRLLDCLATPAVQLAWADAGSPRSRVVSQALGFSTFCPNCVLTPSPQALSRKGRGAFSWARPR